MGSSKSKNAMDNIVDVSTTAVNDQFQSCSNTSDTNQEVQINQVGCMGDSIAVMDGISQSSTTTLNIDCVQEVNLQTEISSDVKQAADQAAEAVTQSLSLGAKAKSKNMMKTTTDIGTEIINQSNNIVANISSTWQSAVINQEDGGGDCTAVMNNINQDALTSQMATAFQGVQSDTIASSGLTQEFSQSAKSTAEGLTESCDCGPCMGVIVAPIISCCCCVLCIGLALMGMNMLFCRLWMFGIFFIGVAILATVAFSNNDSAYNLGSVITFWILGVLCFVGYFVYKKKNPAGCKMDDMLNKSYNKMKGSKTFQNISQGFDQFAKGQAQYYAQQQQSYPPQGYSRRTFGGSS